MDSRQEILHLGEEAFPARRSHVDTAGTHEQVVAEHDAQTLERAAHRGLAQSTPLGGTRDVTLFEQRPQRFEEVQVDLLIMRITHWSHMLYALNKWEMGPLTGDPQ